MSILVYYWEWSAIDWRRLNQSVNRKKKINKVEKAYLDPKSGRHKEINGYLFFPR